MQFGAKWLSLACPHVMGVLNVTPDSFYDGGKYHQGAGLDVSACLLQAEQMLKAGASFIDVGGESTRPGAAPVSSSEEEGRVLPVVEAIASRLDVVISLDTSNPVIMAEGAKLGAGLINDVRALSRDGAKQAAAQTGLPVCLMHMQGQPQSMQTAPSYSSVVDEVMAFLIEAVRASVASGVQENRILIDPGIGFGKDDQQNLALLKSTKRFADKFPTLIGVSRKSMIGRLLGRELDQRLAGSLAFAYEAVTRGASIVRVHDVAETVDVVKVFRLMAEKN